MGECLHFEKCSFFTVKPKDQIQEMAMEGFRRTYCKGPAQDVCIRKSVGAALGGPHKVPPNMLPTGQALRGTCSSDWPGEVLEALAKVRHPR